MRNNIIFLSALLITNLSLFSQPCGNVTNCPGGFNYPFIYCKYDLSDPNKGHSVVRCTSDTWADPTWKPRKIENLPICIDATTYQSTIPIQEEVAGEVVFTRNSALDDIIDACRQWNCLCGKQDDPCYCSIKIRFTKNWNEVGDKYALGAALTNYQAYNCKVNCGSSEIRLNNSNDFTARGSGTPKRFFIIEYEAKRVNYDNINNRGCRVYNLLQTVLHELGHILGFDHYDDTEQTPNVGCYPPVTGLMMKEQGPANGPSFGLYLYDICMFKKLYCPSLVPVEDERLTKEENQIFPIHLTAILP